MPILFALFVQDVSQSLQSYVAAINTALVALGPIGLQDVVVTRLEDGPGRRGRLRTTISYTRSGTVNVGAAYFSANIPTDPGDVDAQAAAFFATNFRARSLFIRDIGDNLRGGLDSNAIMVLYATNQLSNCGQNRARPMIVSALANIAAGASGYAQMVSATGPIPTVILNLVNRSSFTWPAGELGYAAPRVGSCIVDGYVTCCAGPAIPAAPVITPAAGIYPAPQTVTITAGGGATIYYTTDNSAPTTASPIYAGPFVITGSTFIQAVAQVGGGPLSNISQVFVLLTPTAATPVISPAAGSVPSGQLITITDATAGAVIHYTTDGSTPTAASPIYVGPFTIAATTTVKAFAVATGLNDSAVATSAYTVSTIATAAINAITNWDGQVNSMVISGTTLVVGGTFTQAQDASGVVHRNRLLGIDLATGLITAWNPNMNGTVTKVAVDPSGRIWASGAFTTVGGSARGHVARFSAAFATDAFNALADAQVTTLTFDALNAYIGGAFANAGGSARAQIAAFALSNDALQPALVTSMSGSIQDMCFLGTDIYAVGSITNVNGSARAQGFALTGGTTLSAWNPVPNAANNINSIRTDGTSLFTLGFFTTLHGTARNRAGATLPNNTLQTWDPNLNNTPGGEPDSLALSATAAYIAGLFSTVGGTGRNIFAKVDLATGTLQAWNPGQTGQGRCVLYDSVSGSVFCGGIFGSGGAIFVLAA